MKKFNVSLSPKGILSKGIVVPALLVSLAATIIVVELSAIILPHIGSVSSLFGPSGYTGLSSTYPTYYYNSGLQSVILVTWMLVFCLFYALLVFAPAIWLGAKRGVKAAVLVVFFELIWFVFFGIMMDMYLPRLFQAQTPEQPVDCYANCVRAMKPVIYLYPTKQEPVSVQLNYDGTLTDLYPNFSDATSKTWNVVANPDGQLVNTSDGQEYSYLFWEGTDNKKYDLSTGFVVKGSDTASFLQSQLKTMGLEPKEYNEFIVYWLPKLQHNPYNLIHFAGSEYTDGAKLNILPSPDSLLRVFMVYKPLHEPIEVAPQTFPAFERKGFTVVEWGGEMAK